MKHITLTISLLAAVTAAAGDIPDINRRVLSFDNPLSYAVASSYANPSLRQTEHEVSLSDVSALFASHGENAPLSLNRPARDLCADRYWQGGASSFIRHNNSTLWGKALYRNGSRSNVIWNECSDADLLYPYLTADSIGGDLSGERYSLEGGYAERRGRWLWGVELGYDATIEYRDIDPRPRDVTGDIHIAAGASLHPAPSLAAGVSVDARKYKQTCDIMFVSETGKTPIYHLTGLGNHYRRFAGASETSHYSGSSVGITLNLFPLGNDGSMTTGPVATLSLSRFTFDKTLTDINKLPLCHAWHNTLSAQAGYVGASWAATAHLDTYRRHGIENIFGDATSGVYPMIGSLAMYADNLYTVGIDGTCIIHSNRRHTLDLRLSGSYTHRRQIYAEPASEILVEGIDTRLTLGYKGILSPRMVMAASLGAATAIPTRSAIAIPAAEATALPDLHRYGMLSHRNALITLSCSPAYSIDRRYAVGASICYSHGFLHDGMRYDDITASLRFIF